MNGIIHFQGCHNPAKRTNLPNLFHKQFKYIVRNYSYIIVYLYTIILY
jgi:hypothetical protein